MGAVAQRFDAAVLSEVFVSAEIDIAGASYGGEAKADVAGGGCGVRETGEGHRWLRSVDG